LSLYAVLSSLYAVLSSLYAVLSSLYAVRMLCVHYTKAISPRSYVQSPTTFDPGDEVVTNVLHVRLVYFV
jgi:hypothetical protein